LRRRPTIATCEHRRSAPRALGWASHGELVERVVRPRNRPRWSVRLYDCRHTAASWLYAQGVPELQIAAILGHSDPAFTRRTYTHLFPEMRRSAAERIEAAVGRAL